MGNEILIVADDLSGAADCGIACTRRGLETTVILGDTEDSPDTQALAIDANTRSMPAGVAATETARIVRRFGRASGQILFKKVDSTLRGNIGAELAAALGVVRRADASAVIVMAPAFPATGRTTVNGRQLLNGVPLGETEFRTRRDCGGDSDVPTILESAGLRTMLITIECVRDRNNLKKVLRERAASYDALVCDAETDEDLQAIAAATISMDRPAVWSGSAGLAYCLPEASGLSREPCPTSMPPVQGPIVFVVGTPSRVSREQAEVLSNEPGVVIARPQTAMLSEALASGNDVVMLIDEAHQAQVLASYASKIGGLVLTGGETARSALQALNVHSLLLIKEIEPGVPVSVTLHSRPIPVITKAGAFGDRNTFKRCRAAIRSS